METNKASFIKQPTIEPLSQQYGERFPALRKAHALQLVFQEKKFYDNTFSNNDLANPQTADFAIFFVAGKGSKELGLKPQAEHFIVRNKLYRRLSWKDIGANMIKRARKIKANGMRFQSNGKLIYFIVEIEIINEVKEAIANAF